MTAHDGTPPAETARHIVRSVPLGTLATVMRETGGAPYASLVSVATAHDGTPILLISDLADHTRNVARDDRVSLLLNGSEGHEDPLAGERLTLQGRLMRSDDPVIRRRYLTRHPKAAMYADFSDFGFHHLTIDKAHLVAGFGRIHWMEGSALVVNPPKALIDAEADIVTHMNEDHRDAIQLYAARLLGRDGGDWLMTGVDVEGCDLRRQDQVARLAFERPVQDSTDVRKQLVTLVNKARNS